MAAAAQDSASSSPLHHASYGDSAAVFERTAHIHLLHAYVLPSLMIVLGLTTIAYFLRYCKKCSSSKLPPGSYGLPLLGETLQFALFNSCPVGTPPPFLSSRLHRYGSVFKTHLLGRPTLVSMDPTLNKLLLSNEEKLVQVYFPSVVTKIVGPFLTVHGARHRRLRELATTLLSPVAIQAHHVRPLQDHALAILRPWKHSPHIDAQHESIKFVFTYIVKTLLSLKPEDPNTVKLMKDFLFLMTGFSSIPIDFPRTTYNRVLKARERIVSILKNIIRVRQKEARAEPLDFTDVLLKQTDEGGRLFSEQEMVEFIFFFVFGGFETTSILLTNVIKFLSENAHVVDELRREHSLIRRSKKEDEKLTWDDFRQMQFTELVVKEALRMASIAHYVTRESLQDIAFKDMIIPKGWMILINFSMVHLNSNYYPNPLKFDPWRWMDSANNNPTFLMPFGGGIRSCLGIIFTKFEVSIFIHYLVTLYKWDQINKKDGHLHEVSSFSLPSMRKGLPIRVEALSF